MKPKIRKRLMRVALILTLAMSIAAGVLCLPGKVEGLYAAGKLISCMCNSSHYIRFHNGFVIHYATAHEPATLFGRYLIKPDGRVEIYSAMLLKGEQEKLLFVCDRPRVGFAIASKFEKDESCLLMRVPPIGKVANTIAVQEVSRISMPDDTKIVTTYYDAPLTVLREEIKTIKNRGVEQAASPNGAERAVGAP